jgi:hypothetical protein
MDYLGSVGEELLDTLKNAYKVYCDLLAIVEQKLLPKTYRKETTEEAIRLEREQIERQESAQRRRDELYGGYNLINDDYWDTVDGLPPDYDDDPPPPSLREQRNTYEKSRNELISKYNKLLKMGVVSEDLEHPDEAIPPLPDPPLKEESPDDNDIPF